MPAFDITQTVTVSDSPELNRSFPTRAEAVSAIALGTLDSMDEGLFISAAGLDYLKMPAGHPLYGTDPISDMPGYVPAGSVISELFWVKDSGTVAENTAALQEFIDYLAVASPHVGCIQADYEVAKNADRGDGTAALWIDSNNVRIFGYGAKLYSTATISNAFDIIRIGVYPASNGRHQVTRGGIYGLEIDGGANFQRVTNGEFQDVGTLTGWSSTGDGTVEQDGPGDYPYHCLITPDASGDTILYQTISTETGVLQQVVAESLINTVPTWEIYATDGEDNPNGTPLDTAASVTSSVGFHQFTPTSGTSTLCIRVPGGETDPLRLKLVRSWPLFERDLTAPARAIVASGLKDFDLHDLYLHDTFGYGMGLQNGGHENVSIRNLRMSDTLHDGIDCKNNGTAGKNNIIDGLWMTRCAIGLVDSASACLDFHTEGWSIEQVRISEVGAQGASVGGTPGIDAAVRFKAGDLDASRGLGGEDSNITDIQIRGWNPDDSVAGVKLQAGDNTINGLLVEGMGTAVLNGSPGADGNNSANNTIANFNISNVGTAFDIDSSATNFVARSGRVHGTVGTKLTGSGAAAAKFQNVVGIKTQNVLNIEIPVDATTAWTSTSVAHGLAVTPGQTDVSLQLNRGSAAAASAAVVHLRTVGTSSSIVSIQYKVETAGSAGETMDVYVTVDAST